MKKGLLKKSLALCCSITMLATSVPITNVSAADFTDDSAEENQEYNPCIAAPAKTGPCACLLQ